MKTKQFESRTEAEKGGHWAKINRVYPQTGEIVGETEWRRWRTEDGWHADTPAPIIAEFGWMFECGGSDQRSVSNG